MFASHITLLTIDERASNEGLPVGLQRFEEPSAATLQQRTSNGGPKKSQLALAPLSLAYPPGGAGYGLGNDEPGFGSSPVTGPGFAAYRESVSGSPSPRSSPLTTGFGLRPSNPSPAQGQGQSQVQPQGFGASIFRSSTTSNTGSGGPGPGGVASMLPQLPSPIGSPVVSPSPGGIRSRFGFSLAALGSGGSPAVSPAPGASGSRTNASIVSMARQRITADGKWSSRYPFLNT